MRTQSAIAVRNPEQQVTFAFEITSGAKALAYSSTFSARLKSCPDTNLSVPATTAYHRETSSTASPFTGTSSSMAPFFIVATSGRCQSTLAIELFDLRLRRIPRTAHRTIRGEAIAVVLVDPMDKDRFRWH